MPSACLRLARRTSRKGFSLFEVLVCLGIVGIMASIALNSLTQSKRDLVIETMNRRNAQAFATIATCAQCAGVDPIDSSGLEGTLKNIIAGVTVTSGPLEGRTFRINGLSTTDIPGAAYYLKQTDGKLIYEADKTIRHY